MSATTTGKGERVSRGSLPERDCKKSINALLFLVFSNQGIGWTASFTGSRDKDKKVMGEVSDVTSLGDISKHDVDQTIHNTPTVLIASLIFILFLQLIILRWILIQSSTFAVHIMTLRDMYNIPSTLKWETQSVWQRFRMRFYCIFKQLNRFAKYFLINPL